MSSPLQTSSPSWSKGASRSEPSRSWASAQRSPRIPRPTPGCWRGASPARLPKPARRGGEEMTALASRLRREARELAQLRADQDEFLSGAERAAALVNVLRAARVDDPEVEGHLRVAAAGLRRAVSPATESLYRARIDALDARLG